MRWRTWKPQGGQGQGRFARTSFLMCASKQCGLLRSKSQSSRHPGARETVQPAATEVLVRRRRAVYNSSPDTASIIASRGVRPQCTEGDTCAVCRYILQPSAESGISHIFKARSEFRALRKWHLGSLSQVCFQRFAHKA